MKTWYTYHIIDPENNEIFYIGKGRGQRAYVHMTRALKWRNTGKIVPGGNRHLYNKLLKIHDKGLDPIYSIVFTSEIEKEVLDREELDIKNIGIENLCNLTLGGEGETRAPESLLKLSESLRKFWSSEDGYKLKQNYSENRKKENNPMWGKIEDEEHKKLRMTNFLKKPKWNKGLKGDPRAKGPPIGSLPCNAISCKLFGKNNEFFEAKSLKELSVISGVPLTSINKMRAGKINKKGWRLECI